MTVASALSVKLNEETGEFYIDYDARKANGIPLKKFRLIIVHECSMISEELMREITLCMHTNAKVIYMGDNHQLPPVGEEILDSPTFQLENSFILTKRMRQKENSPIIELSDIIANNIEAEFTKQHIIKDRMDKKNDSGEVQFISNEIDMLTSFVNDIKQSPNDPYNAKIITYNNHINNSPQSVKNLNDKVRRILYPDTYDQLFNIGEMVIAYESYDERGLGNLKGEPPEITNSQQFVIKSISKEFRNISVTVFSYQKGYRSYNKHFNVLLLCLKKENGGLLHDIPVIASESLSEWESELKFLWENDRQLAYGLSATLANIKYGYAITTHKAQGSTYNTCYVMEENILSDKNLSSITTKNKSLYTAVTRPKHKLVIVSHKNFRLDLDFLKKNEVISENCIKFVRKDRNSSPNFGEFSNFHLLKNHIKDKAGYEYVSVEHFYQAKKSNDPAIWEMFSTKNNLTANEAKKQGQYIEKRDDWETVKYYVMYEGLKQKYNNNPELKELLISTGDKQLIEYCWWNDQIWGMYSKTDTGCNALGKLLMLLRKEIS
jgi:exodeoxyribonuclease-5